MFPWTRPAEMKKLPHSYVPNPKIKTYERRQKLVHVDDKNPEYGFITVEEVYEKSSVDRQEYINSFRDDVGIENILKKVQMSGDMTLLNQRQAVQGEPGEVKDITIFQEDEETLAALGDSAAAKYAALPVELTKGRTMEQFLKEVNAEEINAFIEAIKGGKEDGAK